MNEAILSLLGTVAPADADAMRLAEARQAKLAKPPGSLGRLEAISVRVSGILGRMDARLKRRRVLVFASDNGVVAEGVACAPQSVTRTQALNIARGLTGVGVLARHFSCEVEVIDVGVNGDLDETLVRNEKVARGTNDFARGPAMTRKQAERAFLTGADAARRAAADGIEILGIGEMGIGNTTTSAAVLCALTGRPASEVVGRGGGLSDEGLARKVNVIDCALSDLHPDPEDPLDALSKVGGFDLCAMAGAFVGAASARVPAVVDGFISAVAALCAFRLAPDCRDYMFASHGSAEKGYRVAMDALGLRPMLDLGMRLGEGSGCPIAFEIISAAMDILNDMATFEEAGIDDGYLDDIRRDRTFTEGV